MKAFHLPVAVVLSIVAVCASFNLLIGALPLVQAVPLSRHVAYDVTGGAEDTCYTSQQRNCPEQPSMCGDILCDYDKKEDDYFCRFETEGSIDYRTTYTDCVESASGTYEERYHEPGGADTIYCWKWRFCKMEDCVFLTDGKHYCAEGVGSGDKQKVDGAGKCQEDEANNRCPPQA